VAIMRINNDYANKLLKDFRNGENIKPFMDAISGVENYKISNLSKQGCIRGMFAKEIIADQFVLDFEDIISIFWQAIFENVDRAKFWGEEVEIKLINGTKIVNTNNNPIHYLRKQAYFAVRNHITALYRKNLKQTCGKCGYTTSTRLHKECKKCGGLMSSTYKFMEIDEDGDQLVSVSMHSTIENDNMEVKISNIIDDFGKKILGQKTRAYQILRILTEPSASINMCSKCNLCEARTFNIDMCTNYSANIGKYLGVNKTMIANKMRRIRKAMPEYLMSEGTDTALYLLDLIPTKYKVFCED
jgi:hypothetical protein